MMMDSYLRNQASPIATLPLPHESTSNILKKQHLHTDDSKQENSDKRKANKQRPASANSAGRFKGFTFRDFQDKSKFSKIEVILFILIA